MLLKLCPDLFNVHSTIILIDYHGSCFKGSFNRPFFRIEQFTAMSESLFANLIRWVHPLLLSARSLTPSRKIKLFSYQYKYFKQLIYKKSLKMWKLSANLLLKSISFKMLDVYIIPILFLVFSSSVSALYCCFLMYN